MFNVTNLTSRFKIKCLVSIYCTLYVTNYIMQLDSLIPTSIYKCFFSLKSTPNKDFLN